LAFRHVQTVTAAGVRSRHHPKQRESLRRALLQLAALPLRQSSPDAEPLVVLQRVLQALAAHLAPLTDALGLPRRATLLREERLRVGLRAQRALLPVMLPGHVEQLAENIEFDLGVPLPFPGRPRLPYFRLSRVRLLASSQLAAHTIRPGTTAGLPRSTCAPPQ